MHLYSRRFWWLSLMVSSVLVTITVIVSLRWPIAFDASIMHYIAWRIAEGDVPYRDLHDMNWPGSYLMHYALIKAGCADLGARVLDLAVTFSLAGLMAWCLSRFGRLVSLTVALSFIAFHLSGTLLLALQREGLYSLLVMVGLIALVKTRAAPHAGWYFFSGACVGAATTVKPVVMLLTVFLTVFQIVASDSRERWLRLLAWLTGYALPLGGMVLVLQYMGALPDFLETAIHYTPLHAAVTSPEPLWQLTRPTAVRITLVVMSLGLVGFLAREVRREAMPFDNVIWMTACLFGGLAWILQGKNWPYHFYPLIVFIGPAVACGVSRVPLSDRSRTWGAVCLSVMMMLLGLRAYSHRHLQEVEIAVRDVETSLDRSVDRYCPRHQPIASLSMGYGLNSLRTRNLAPASRLLYDSFVVGTAESVWTERLRTEVVSDLDSRASCIVIFKYAWPTFRGYDRYDRFPALVELLDREFELAHEEDADALHGYRIYVRR